MDMMDFNDLVSATTQNKPIADLRLEKEIKDLLKPIGGVVQTKLLLRHN